MNIGIIGLGLIGGSLGRAILERTDAAVYGFDTDAGAVKKALLLKAVTDTLGDEQYSKLDLLIVALNPSVAIEVMREKLPLLKSGAVVMDIAGNKTAVVTEMKKLASARPDIEFISSHPMAGREFSGISHSTSKLFDNASILLIPVNAGLPSLTNIKSLLLKIGFSFVKMTTESFHDKIIAYTSQLPHIISSCYINNTLAPLHDGFSAGSFKDLSRVAKMNPDMWTELISDNAHNVLPVLDEFIANLTAFRECLNDGDRNSLRALFSKGNAVKEEVTKNSREWKKENADR